jgi:hypothetical protein
MAIPLLREVVARLAGSWELLLTLPRRSRAIGNNNSSNSNSRWAKVATMLVDDHWYFLLFFLLTKRPLFHVTYASLFVPMFSSLKVYYDVDF